MFDPQHPIYQPIPDNCPLYEHSQKIVDYIATEPVLRFDTGSNSPPIYEARSADPIWTIRKDGREFKVRAPSGIKAGTGVDGPLIILDPEYAGFCTSGFQPTEFRMWKAVIRSRRRTITPSGMGCGSYRSDGALLTNERVQPGRVPRALGQAEAYGQNTGSGCSYTVGMIRPTDVSGGRIAHAIRVAAGYLHSSRFFWPALHTEGGANSGYLTPEDKGCPMGARVFLDPSVDALAIGNAAASRLSDTRQKLFVRSFVVALQEFGMIPLDGTETGSNVYFEGTTANWPTVLGPVNSYGSYNDVARAIEGTLPWRSLRVAHPSVFDGFAR